MSGHDPNHHTDSSLNDNLNNEWWPNEEVLSPRQLPLDHSFDSLTLDLPNVFFDSPSISSNSPAFTPLSDSQIYQGWRLPYNNATTAHSARALGPRSMSVSAVPAATRDIPTAPSSRVPPPKQIRFVATDGQPHAKRRRINAACLTCRKRKTRCSGERPECQTCIDTAHTCAGYADKPTRKPGEKQEEESEDEESGDSPPKKVASNERRPPPTQAVLPARSVPPPDPTGLERVSSNAPLKSEDVEIRSPGSNHTASSQTPANRVPYFRYFGPTAIVPGFKQMVVAVKDHRRSLASESPASGQLPDSVSTTGLERAPVEIPFYDATDASPNAPMITQLCQTFFTHIGCNYPFLQRERFLRDLEEKKVDAILVDAVCAVAARFSSDSQLKRSNDDSIPREENGDVRRAFRGQVFAHRAMSAIVETFQFPTIAAAQASLLLAYEEFGTDHDSGLWMYLGTAIRMAQDLGIQKLEGLHYEGRLGPTPKTAKRGEEGKVEEARRASKHEENAKHRKSVDSKEQEDRKASEQERIDTFWSVFFLDRAVSSGVGRPVSLRDKDIEISFPYRPDDDMVNGYPHPFPPMIRIVHMYGRVADVLNNIKDVDQVTPEVLKRLGGMEKDLTGIYQRLSPRLHFNATNFQHYVKAEQGTNFILLHFWFHTLIVLLHQPTLLHSFEGRIQQLFPDSRELSMSSAKTIADILAFAELIDVKSFVGNPFTSQPMYVAACAFLAEAAAHTSQPPSRGASPGPPAPTKPKSETVEQQRAATAKHTLLASAANQNYQRCYKALKILDSYWAGCRYILVALDQKSKGLMDPLLYTSDDIDGPMPSTEPSFTSPGWRRSTSMSASLGQRLKAMREANNWLSSSADWNKAIGWSLTGTVNSPQPNLSFLYPHNTNDDTEREEAIGATPTSNHQQYPTSMMPPPRRASMLPYDPVTASDPASLMNLNSTAFPIPTGGTPQNAPPPTTPASLAQAQAQSYDFADPNMSFNHQSAYPYAGDMLSIESQDVDMVSGGMSGLTFPGGDMIPWLEYLPQDVLNYFGDVVVDDEEGVRQQGGGSAVGD